MSRVLPFLLVILAVIGCESTSTVEDPSATHFIKFYGRDGDQTGRDLVVLPDGSMVLFGTSLATSPILGVQWYVVKVDAKGTIIWEQEYGGGFDEEARDIEVTSTGNLVLVGNSYKTTTDRDVMVLILSMLDGTQLDSALVPTNEVNFPYPSSSGDEDASTITETTDGFIVSGTTTYVSNPSIPIVVDTHDAFHIRLESDLDVYAAGSWTQVTGFAGDDGFIKVFEALPNPDGVFFYAVGYSNLDSTGTVVGYNYWLRPVGSNGDNAGADFYIGTLSADEKLSSVAFTGSQFILTGVQVSTSSDIYYVAANVPQSDEITYAYEKTLSTNLGSNLGGHTSVALAPINGGYYILGEENGFNNNQNWFLTRVNLNGTLGWVQPIVYGGEGFDSAGAVKELPDGRVVIIGTMRTGRPDAGEYKMTLVKVSREGKFEK